MVAILKFYGMGLVLGAITGLICCKAISVLWPVSPSIPEATCVEIPLSQWSEFPVSPFDNLSLTIEEYSCPLIST
jgi:hypothetical protein